MQANISLLSPVAESASTALVPQLHPQHKTLTLLPPSYQTAQLTTGPVTSNVQQRKQHTLLCCCCCSTMQAGQHCACTSTGRRRPVDMCQMHLQIQLLPVISYASYNATLAAHPDDNQLRYKSKT
jgi:hypothetical protein